MGRAFFDAFRWTDPVRRARVLGMIVAHRRQALHRSARRLRRRAGQPLSAGEAAQIGQVLGELGGETSLPRWAEWLEPTGLFRKSIAGTAARQIAAALALSEIRAEQAGSVLEAALEAAEPEVQEWILGALAQRERNAPRRS